MPNPLKPELGVLVKLGSIAIHTKEMLSPGGHPFDKLELDHLLEDPEVAEWLKAMDEMAFLPKMREER